MTMTIPETDFTVIEGLDFAPRCESDLHDQGFGSEDDTAVAVLTYEAQCCFEISEGFICMGCLTFTMSNENACGCDSCGGWFEPYHSGVKNVVFL